MTQATNCDDKLNTVLARIDQEFDHSLQHLFQLLRIQSISTDPDYKTECDKAANWLVSDLSDIGFEAEKIVTEGHPMVIAKYHNAKDAPTVLFYGHYDVQPVDPLNLWDNPPFEPEIKTGLNGTKQITGRGTSDDKGQLMTFVEACRAWICETGNLPVNVTILFEGEEESGSPSLIPFLNQYSDYLNADIALVCDTTMWDNTTPAISTSLRGMVSMEVTLHAANRDLHSGFYGGAAHNPIHLLTKILADMRDDNGVITLPGFYDGVLEVPESQIQQWNNLGFSERQFLGEIGLKIPAGENDRSVLERIWARPTFEVNGIYGGYIGEGFKTVIPATATAKVSFRLAGKQDPVKIRDDFKAYVEAALPADCSATFEEIGCSGAIHVDISMPQVSSAAKALTREWGKETALIGMGGSIPVVGHFQDILKMQSLLIGFGL